MAQPPPQGARMTLIQYSDAVRRDGRKMPARAAAERGSEFTPYPVPGMGTRP